MACMDIKQTRTCEQSASPHRLHDHPQATACRPASVSRDAWEESSRAEERAAGKDTTHVRFPAGKITAYEKARRGAASRVRASETRALARTAQGKKEHAQRMAGVA